MTLVDQCAGWFSSSGWRLRPLECAHGWTRCGVVQKDRAVVRQASPIGDSSWHERSNCSLKSRNRRKRILFEVPSWDLLRRQHGHFYLADERQAWLNSLSEYKDGQDSGLTLRQLGYAAVLRRLCHRVFQVREGIPYGRAQRSSFP